MFAMLLAYRYWGAGGLSTGEHYAKIDLGIVKYHFEIGAGKDNFTWG